MDLSRRSLLLGAGASAGAGALLAPMVAGHMADPASVEADAVRADSLWTQQARALPSMPTFSGTRKVDLAIVGGGYTGLSCAYYVKKMRPDWSVIVLESHQIGSGASSRNTGALSARQVGISDAGFPERGLKRLEHFMAEEQIDCDYKPVSTLMVHASESAAKDAQANLPDGAEWISASELRDSISSDYYFGATQVSDYFLLDPAKLVVGNAMAALRAGAELFERSPVLSIKADGSTPALTTPHGEIEAKQVFVATNAYTPRLGLHEHDMFPLHQFTLATRKLSEAELAKFGLDRWALRFENRTLPVTFRLTASGHFFVRLVLGYATHNSCTWGDLEGAKAYARTLFEQRYPGISDLGLDHGWHGVTGHTVRGQQILASTGDGKIHVSAAYNGLGIMPAHNSGYLSATKIVGTPDPDLQFVEGASQLPFPGDFYRSLILKPFMSMMAPV